MFEIIHYIIEQNTSFNLKNLQYIVFKQIIDLLSRIFLKHSQFL